MLLSFTKNNKKRLLYVIFFLVLVFNEEIIKRKRISVINQRTHNTNLSSTTTKVAASYGCGPCLSDNKQHIYLLLVVLCHNYKCYPKAVFKRSPFIITGSKMGSHGQTDKHEVSNKSFILFYFFWHTIRSGVWGLRQRGQQKQQ